jgi:hypothetical protein
MILFFTKLPSRFLSRVPLYSPDTGFNGPIPTQLNSYTVFYKSLRIWKDVYPNYTSHLCYSNAEKPKVAEWLELALFLRIREVPWTDLSPKTKYTDWGFSWPFSVFPRKFRESNLNETTTASFRILSNSLFTNHPANRHHIILSYWLNK